MTATAAAVVAVPAGSEELADRAAPLDSLLVQATRSPLRRFVPTMSTAKFAAGLVRHPARTGRRLAGLAGEITQVAAGTSAVTPSRRDRRFTDTAWTDNPILRRLVQAYLATGQVAEDLVTDAELDWRDAERVHFLVENLTEAMAPSNVPLLNPASAKAVVDTAGLSLVRGARNLVKDMARAPRVPAMVDTSAFEVGRNLAATPGAVVLRTEIFELIQYAPQTDQVHRTPLLIVPPTINKNYALDLAPGRSLVEYLVRQGQQVFMISWRNPDARHAGWGLDAYVGAVLEALDAVERVAGVESTALTGVCAGGIVASLAAAHLAATGGRDRLAAFTLLVTVLDNAEAGTSAALVDQSLAEAAKAMSRRRGYLDGRALAEVFAWLRPGDLIWNYWVNNYLLGQQPPAFDILFWNADTTRMTARLHADFIDIGLSNGLITPGAVTILGTPVDLSRVAVDAYVVAGIADHITPWQNCYRSAQLLGGDTRFVLSTSGHIAALVNPPTNPKATFQTNKDTTVDAQHWLQSARTQQGSWWPDFAAWLAERSGPLTPAPSELGGGGLRPLAEAPATSTKTEGEGPMSNQAASNQVTTNHRATNGDAAVPAARALQYQGIGRSLGTDYFHIADQLTESERDYWRRTRDFVDDEVLPVINEYWENAELPWPLFKRMGELGIIGDGIEGYGCPEMSPLAVGLINMELNRGDGSLATFLGVQAGLAMRSIAMLGSEEQKQRWLPGMARVDILGAFALTEPDHGSDSVALETSARREGEHWVINGRKKWIGNGTLADVVVLWARDEADGRVKGFLVEKGTPGYAATRIDGKGSLRAIWQAEITLTDLRVPEANRLPGANSFKDAGAVLAGTRNTVAWAALGHATAAYDIAAAYTRQRTQFGKPLVGFQIVQQRLVRMLAEVCSMQLYCLQLARLQEQGALTDTIAALAKMNNTRRAREVIGEGRDLLGGNGILLDYHVIRHMADIEALHTYEGTETIQTLIVGRDITGVGAFA